MKITDALVVKLVDTKDLNYLSAPGENQDVEPFKFGEGLTANTEPRHSDV